MKVVAIKDAPLINKKWPNGTHQAYYIGDVFDTADWDDEYKQIVYKDGIYEHLVITEENFVSLEEWRELQINKLGL